MNLQKRFPDHLPMSPDELRDLLECLGLSQNAAADFLGISGASVRHWAAGRLPVSPPSATLLRLMVAEGYSPDDVRLIVDQFNMT